MPLGNNPVGEPLNSTNLDQKEIPSEKKQIIKTVKNVGGIITSVDDSAIENKESPKNTKKDKLITRSPSLDSLNLIESHSIDEELEKIKSESPATSTAVSGTNPALLAEGEYKVIVSSEDNKGLSMYANVVNETKWDDPTRASHAKFLAGNPIFFGGKIWVNNEKKYR